MHTSIRIELGFTSVLNVAFSNYFQMADAFNRNFSQRKILLKTWKESDLEQSRWILAVWIPKGSSNSSILHTVMQLS